MPLLRERIYTIEDIYALPEGERAELIDGHIYYMAPPNTMHQRISSILSRKIGNYIDSNKGKCEVFAAPFAVYLDEKTNTYVEPDVSVICDPDKLDDRGCKGAPDWIIEIASSGTKRIDYGVKLFKYHSAGVREYWIVNPLTRTVNVYDLEKEELTDLYSFDDDIQVCIYDDLTINITELLKQ